MAKFALKALSRIRREKWQSGRVQLACLQHWNMFTFSVLFMMLAWFTDLFLPVTAGSPWICELFWQILLNSCLYSSQVLHFWLPAFFLFLFLLSLQTWKRIPTLLTHCAQSTPCIPEIGVIFEPVWTTQHGWIWFSSAKPLFKTAVLFS